MAGRIRQLTDTVDDLLYRFLYNLSLASPFGIGGRARTERVNKVAKPSHTELQLKSLKNFRVYLKIVLIRK